MDKTTILHENHIQLGAKMTPFGGFDMPLYYTDIITEHNAVRNEVGIFDVSHMGEIVVSGKEAENFIQYLFTNDISNAQKGQIFYGMMLHDDGGTVDDLLVYVLDNNKYLLVVNASNIEKDFEHIKNVGKDFSVTIENKSENCSQLALQGPKAQEYIKSVLNFDCDAIPFYQFRILKTQENNSEIIISRTGYTGEDGFEIYSNHDTIVDFWNKLISAGIQPCGLGCRDTLRFEVGLPLYGHELSDEISPIMAGLSMFVKLNKNNFIGKLACLNQKENGEFQRKIVGIELREKGIPRSGYPIMAEGKEIGYVTTGYKSISTGKFICMALIDSNYAKLDTEVFVSIHNKQRKGFVVKKRFYQKRYKK